MGAAAAGHCGRVNFMDWHADTLGFSPDYPACELALEEDGYAPYPTTAPFYSHGMTFPTECDSGPMTPQEAVVEFMLFDVSSCVTPYQATCTSESCAQQGINCGPAGDGCGNLIQCGTCPAGETCGGGGTPSVCGSSCDPKSCAAQGIQCGPAGDGCGNSLSCGTCPAGQTCGAGHAGHLRIRHLHPEELRGAEHRVRTGRRRVRQRAQLRELPHGSDLRRRRHAGGLRRACLHAEDVHRARHQLRPCRRRLRQRARVRDVPERRDVRRRRHAGTVRVGRPEVSR